MEKKKKSQSKKKRTSDINYEEKETKERDLTLTSREIENKVRKLDILLPKAWSGQ